MGKPDLIFTVPGRNGLFAVPSNEETIDGIGVLITFPDGIQVYHSDDTGYVSFRDYIRRYDVDIALVCINGKYGNMNYREAALLSSKVKAKVAIPQHYDMVALNSEDPQKFVREVKRIAPNKKCEVVPVLKEFLFANRS